MTSLATKPPTKRLYLIEGVPGVGKTTLAEALAEALDDSATIATDDYWDIKRIPWDRTKLNEAHQWTQNIVIDWMRTQYPVLNIIVHNTFTQKWEREPYKKLAFDHGYELIEVAIKSNADADVLAARNLHNVSRETIIKMRNRWED